MASLGRRFIAAAVGLVALIVFQPTARAAGNFAFAVPGPDGLQLVISGYDKTGGELFRTSVDRPETYNDASHYIIRVDETILANNTLAKWCVTDEARKWAELPPDDTKATLCDDKPSETRGTYLFVSRTLIAGPPEPEPVELLAGPEAVACVQTELNGLGFEAGAVDGQLGRGTNAALVRFAERQLVTFDLPPLERDSAGAWCAELRALVTAGTGVRAGSGTVDLVFGSDIDAKTRAETHAALVAIEAYASSTLGYTLVSRPSIYLSSDPAWMADAYLKVRNFGEQFRKGKIADFEKCNGGEGGHGFIFMCAKSNVFSGDWFGLGSAAQRKFAFTHEYFHMIQYELAGERSWGCCSDKQDSVKLIGPTWLVEGAAEYLAFAILRDDGWSGFDGEIAYHTSKARDESGRLSGLVSRKQFYANQWAVSSGMIGTQLLEEKVGLGALKLFWAGLGEGKKWPAAFEAAYGTTPEAFDDAFAEHVGL